MQLRAVEKMSRFSPMSLYFPRNLPKLYLSPAQRKINVSKFQHLTLRKLFFFLKT